MTNKYCYRLYDKYNRSPAGHFLEGTLFAQSSEEARRIAKGHLISRNLRDKEIVSFILYDCSSLEKVKIGEGAI